MLVSGAKSRLLLAAAVASALAASGCGGAKGREAKHLAKGKAYLADGNFEKARLEFRNALQLVPTDSEARFENGVVDERLGNPREAAQFYQGAIDSNAENVAARAALGRIYVLSGAPDRALEVIKPALEKHPDDPALLTDRAAARVQLKDQDGALADAERAVQLAPSSEDAISVLAGIYRSGGSSDKAEQLLQDGIKRIPKSVDLRLAYAQLESSLNKAPEVEAVLLDLVRIEPKDKANRLRLAQFYARLDRLDEAEHVLRDGVRDLPDERDMKSALIQFLALRRSREVAEKELSAFVAAAPKDYELKFELAAFYVQGKDIKKAEAILSGVIDEAKLEGPGITARDRLAALRVEQNDIPGAQKLIAEVLAASPRDSDALIMRGNIALAEKDPKTAITDLRAVLRDQPNAVGVMRSLARAHMANGEPQLAEDTMRRALEANPKDPSVRLDLAQLLSQLGHPEQAKPIIDELVKQQPTNVAALETQFKVAAATNDLVTAKAAADGIVANQPKSPFGYFYQGAVAEADKRFSDAAAMYDTAISMQPEAIEPLQGLVRVLQKLNRQAEAMKRLDETIAKYPKLALAANFKGETLLAEKRPADAIAPFKLAIERDPKWWMYYRNLAAAQLAIKDTDAAIATLSEGRSKVTDVEALDVELASVYEYLHRPDDAIAVYERALATAPKSDVAANNLSMLLVKYRKDAASLDRAKQLASRFAVSPNASFLDTYGWVLYKRGEAAEAVNALRNASSKAPNSPTALYHLGMAEALAGQPEAARDALTRSLKSGKNFDGMDEAKATLDKLAGEAPSLAAPPKT
jgi:tetratricopeptide (TPR) repeat protein